VGFSQPNPSDRLPSDQRGKPTYRAFLRKLTHCTVPGLTNDRFGLPAPPIIMVKAFLRPGLPVCDLENTYFRSPFWRDIGITQTKSGSSTVDSPGLAWRGAMGQFNVGEVVTCIPMISRSAAPGDYKIVGEMPERDGDRMYRIKSPLEEHERVVGESLLVRSEGHLPDGAMAQRSRRGSITLPKLRIALRIDADDEPDGWSVVSVPGH
jgi:hypothetical protein